MDILIADGHDRVRHALRVLLTQQPGLQVVGQAANGQELLAQVSLVTADLILVDWDLPGLTEVGGLPAIRQTCPTMQMIVLSSRPGVRRAALSSGADAFVSKGDPPERLLTVIRRYNTLVTEGGAYVTPE